MAPLLYALPHLPWTKIVCGGVSLGGVHLPNVRNAQSIAVINEPPLILLSGRGDQVDSRSRAGSRVVVSHSEDRLRVSSDFWKSCAFQGLNEETYIY